MRDIISPGTGRRYPLTMICAVFRVPRSTVYRTMAPMPAGPLVAAKRGPKTSHSDAEVVEAIHAVLAARRVPRRRLSQGAGAHRAPGPGHRREARRG